MFSTLQYRRLAAIILLVVASFAYLFYRLFEIQVSRHQELATKARRFTETLRVLEAWRGQIRDRNGKILAISVPVKTVYANLSLCSNRLDEVARTCGPLLQIPPEALARRLRAALQRGPSGNAGRQKALVVKRNVPVAEWNTIASALQIEMFGTNKSPLTATQRAELQKFRHEILFVRDAQVRLYPYGSSLSSLLGVVAHPTNSAALEGICGVEMALDGTLAGENGFCASEQDAAGNELPYRRMELKSPRDGDNVMLTIDARLQQIVERVLAAAQNRYHARAASAILMNPRTFEILALVCSPGFNPQTSGASAATPWRIAALSDRVEPGSTFKTITLAAALDQGLMTLDSGVYCEQGRFVFNKVAVHDHAPYGLLTLRQAFARSSNIAFAKTALALGPERLYRYMTNFGFGQRTGLPLGNETPGRIEPPRTWSTMALTRAAFGQGVSVSQLQMTIAMCVVANEGRLMRPMLVSRIQSPQGQVLQRSQPQFVRHVIRPETARQVREALEAVVSPGGTGALASMDRYTVAAKTGTAQKSDQHGYEKGRYYSSMIGFLPADAPQLVISVALDEPENGYYAGTVVAPAFRAIAEQAAACLSIPPDKRSNNGAGNLMAQANSAVAQPVRVGARQSSKPAKAKISELASLSRR